MDATRLDRRLAVRGRAGGRAHAGDRRAKPVRGAVGRARGRSDRERRAAWRGRLVARRAAGRGLSPLARLACREQPQPRRRLSPGRSAGIGRAAEPRRRRCLGGGQRGRARIHARARQARALGRRQASARDGRSRSGRRGGGMAGGHGRRGQCASAPPPHGALRGPARRRHQPRARLARPRCAARRSAAEPRRAARARARAGPVLDVARHAVRHQRGRWRERRGFGAGAAGRGARERSCARGDARALVERRRRRDPGARRAVGTLRERDGASRARGRGAGARRAADGPFTGKHRARARELARGAAVGPCPRALAGTPADDGQSPELPRCAWHLGRPP